MARQRMVLRQLRTIAGMLAATIFAGALAGGMTHGDFQPAAAADLTKAKATAKATEYAQEPLPPGIQVISTELEGPVFADAQGRTLYKWPVKPLRNGAIGEQKTKPTCDDTHYRETSGFMSPYPPGFELPEVDTRPSCLQLWPALYAPEGAKETGKWTAVTRPDGKKQWAYDGYALYTSSRDKLPGDTYGGTNRKAEGDAPAYREPVGPKPGVPSQFGVYQVAQGRLLTTAKEYSVYTSDRDGPNTSNCDTGCLQAWAPILAPESAVSQGDWAVIERSPGVKQWAFRKRPLYARIADRKVHGYEGSDEPGWHNVFVQKAPAPPKGFTMQDTRGGVVLADSRGHTIYLYSCADDALDQQACDNPDSPQAYRFAICGGGDPDVCVRTFPYVIADKDAKAESRTWTVMDIDPKTGHRASAGQTGALHVWAFRDRPVYLFGGDKDPGDVEADAWGEFNGHRNGFKAFWLRDDFRENAG